jgi:hypothetical protein
VDLFFAVLDWTGQIVLALVALAILLIYWFAAYERNQK